MHDAVNADLAPAAELRRKGQQRGGHAAVVNVSGAQGERGGLRPGSAQLQITTQAQGAAKAKSLACLPAGHVHQETWVQASGQAGLRSGKQFRV